VIALKRERIESINEKSNPLLVHTLFRLLRVSIDEGIEPFSELIYKSLVKKIHHHLNNLHPFV